jgi:hypothetical protein
MPRLQQVLKTKLGHHRIVWFAVGFCGLVSRLVGSQAEFFGVSSGGRASILTEKVWQNVMNCVASVDGVRG